MFIDTQLMPLRRDFPELKIVFEHITTREAAQYVHGADRFTAATVTAHHLLFNRNAIFTGGIRPHYYCLPVLKREVHRLALVEAATSGSPKFFLGTDSAPHPAHLKEHASGCAGCYTAHAAMELYAQAFDRANALDRLEAFASFNGPAFYGLPRNSGTITLRRETWTPPESYPFGEAQLKPLARRRAPDLAPGLIKESLMIAKPRVALLIDADNSPASKIDLILNELSTFGETSIRRAYGNWKKAELKGWEDILHEHAIRPIQQFDYSKGKNASDIAMVIDALDLLYTDSPDAFGIVSSDADFTPLVMHLRAKGAAVYGFGARKTPEPFVNACSRFLFLDKLREPTAEPESEADDRRRAVRCRCGPPPRNSSRTPSW